MYGKAVLTILLFAAFAHSARAVDAESLWSGKLLPILDANCVKCHGIIQQKSGLDLGSLETLLKGGDEGTVVVPGKPEKSRLYLYTAPDCDPHMPPKKQLKPQEIELVRKWIAAGAPETTEFDAPAVLVAKVAPAAAPPRIIWIAFRRSILPAGGLASPKIRRS